MSTKLAITQCLATLVLLLLSYTVHGQITGTNPVVVGATETYTYNDGNLYTRRNWQITNGTIISSTYSGTSNSCTVTWSSTCGTGTLTFRNLSTVISTLNVTINATLATPTGTFSTTQYCRYTTLTRNGTPPTGETWYWQTSASGTSTSYSGSTYDITSAGYYYLRAYACGYWSTNSLSTGHIGGPINPAAPTATNGSRCGTGTVVISATPGSQSDNIRWYDASSGGSLLGTGTSYTTPSISSLTYYYAASYHTATNCESTSRTLVSANVYAVPDVSASGQTLCSGQATSISITNPNGVSGTTFSWTVSASGVSGASNGSGTSIVQTLTTTAEATGTVTYTITPATANCSGTPINAVVTVQALGTPSGTFSTTAYCQSVDIMRNGSPPSGITWYWQTSSSGTSTANSGATYSATSSGYYYLRAYGCSTWSTSSLSTAYIAVPSLPAAPSVTGGTRCGTGTVGLGASIGAGGDGIRWYAAASGGSPLATGTSYTTPSLSSTTTYYACTYIVATGCESSRTAVTATVNPLPGDATSATSNPTALYGSGSVTLNATGAAGGETYAWYTVSSGGTALPSNTPSLSSTTTYYVSRKVTATGCESANRISFSVGVYPIASITPSATQYLAYGGSVSLSANAGYYSYQWLRNDTIISAATSQSYLVKRTGVYKVQVKGSSIAPTYTTPTGVIVNGPTSQALNLVSTTQIHKEGLTLSSVIDTLSRDKLTQVISYMDGMGRTFQTLAVAASPDQFDLVSATGPEKQGLAITSYLPYISTTNDGLYRPNALRGSNGAYTSSEQYNFYQNASLVAHDTKPYSKAVYRQTPDARALESGAPGSHWQPVAGDTTHTVRSVISFNTTADSVRKWDNAGVSSGYYAANTVVVETNKDENGNQVISYTNALGQLVLKKVQYETTKWLKTYYVYDEYGRLKFQVPPRAVGLLDSTPNLVADTNLTELIYTYTYDNKSRVIAKKVPGAEEESIVYDKLDRIVLTQDGNLKSRNKWMFIKYDYYGRPVYSGLFNSSSSRTTLQSALDSEDYTQSGVKWYEYEMSGANDYSNQAYPRSNTTVLTVNYYDHYDFNRDNSADYNFDGSHLSGQETAALTAARGSATGSRRQTVDAAGNPTGTWLKNVIFYGAYDRVIQTLSNNHLYSTLADKTTIIYNFAGQVVKSKTTHTSSASFSVSYVDRPVYDHAGRVVKQYRQINSDAEQLLAEYVYNKLGQVVDKNLHYSGGSYLQSVDYRYNIRGWLTSINNAQLTSDGSLNDDTGDYFGMELAYEKVISGMSNSRQSNGNISAMKWRTYGTTGAAGQRSYKYAYDNSDRLTAATFQASSAASTWDKEVNTLNETLTYDANGNIKSLVRKRNSRGLSGTTVTSTPQTIDDLSYIYQSVNGGTQNSNVLVRVNEAVGGTVGEAGFKNGDNSDTEFTYTTWGSVKKDGNKQIDSVVYNFLGKPSRVYFHNGFVVSYTYDAAGGKLSVKTDSVATTKSFFNYIGGFVYEGATPALSFFSSPEGRVVKNGGSYEYQYSISDHQGNTRVLFTSATPSPVSLTANMESPTNDDFKNATTNRISFELYDHTDFSGTTYSYSQKLTGASGQQVGVAKSFKVYPGDKIRIEAYAKYMASSGSSNLAGFATALLSAFGYAPPGSGETGTPGAGLNTWGGIVAAGGGNGSGSYPKAFVNLLVFDKNYNFLDVAWDQINSGEQVGASPKAAHDYLMQEYTAKEEGYIYVYVSNENSTLVEVYFDDVVVTQTKTNLIQGNEYYPFGMQTANSWTREAVTGNNYLANGGTELNTTTQLYDLDFRNYDPALGRMYGVDPVAAKYASLTPYNYSFNNPTAFSDVSGADPNETVNYSAMNGQYYSAYTYDDKIESRQTAVWYDAMGWRNEVPGANAFYNRATGGYPGASGGGGWVLTIGSLRIDFNSLEDGSHFFGVENGEVTYYNHRSTRDLLVEAGTIIAKNNYGGDGRMKTPEKSHRSMISLPAITRKTLPMQTGERPIATRTLWMVEISAFNKAVDEFNSKFSIKKAVAELNRQAGAFSTGKCAQYFRQALEEGGLSTDGRPNHAKDYGAFLIKLGFTPITTNEYLVGDVVVWQGFSGVKGTLKDHPFGHVQMFNGTIWKSDYAQNSVPSIDPTGFWPGGDYRIANPSWQAFRWEFKWPH